MKTRREVLAATIIGLPMAAQAAEAKVPLFKEHSANLKRLREAGSLKLGARYSDKGLIVLAAASEEEARGEIEKDPTVQAQVFAYELHPFNVFYSGCL